MTPHEQHTQKVGDIVVKEELQIEEQSKNNLQRNFLKISLQYSLAVGICGSSLFVRPISAIWSFLFLTVALSEESELDSTATETSFGYIVALYSFGQCIASPAFGYWSNRIKQVCAPTIFGLNMMLLGNLIYLFMDLLPSGYQYAMAVSRILIGVGSSNAVLLRAYASTSSTSADRSRAIGCVAAGIAVGLVIGPGLQAMFTPLGEEGIHVIFGWSLTVYKAPALLAAIINIFGILLMGFAFNEQYAGLKNDNESTPLPPADLVAVAVCVATRFTQLSTIANIETLGSAYSMLMFDFSGPEAVAANSMSQAVQGIAAAFILLPFIFLDIGKRLKQRTVNIACILGFLAFHLVTYPWDFGNSFVNIHQPDSPSGGCDAQRFVWCSTTPRVNKWLYYASLCVIFEVSFAISNVVLPTLFSKVIGPRRQGTMQGIFQMSGSIARMVAPVFLNLVYSHFGPKGVWQAEIAQLVLTLILWFVFLARLVPLEKLRPVKEEIQKRSA